VDEESEANEEFDGEDEEAEEEDEKVSLDSESEPPAADEGEFDVEAYKKFCENESN